MSIYIQPASNTTIPTSGAITKTLIKKGDTVDVIADVAANPRGTFIAGYGYVMSASIDRSEGAVSTVTYQCSDSITSTGSLAETQLSDTWGLSSTQVDIPLKAFCGISPGQDPSLWHIERWEQEKDFELYNLYRFRDARSGLIYDLNSISGTTNTKTITMAQMIRAGVESVIRYFPLVTHQRTYKAEPEITHSLGQIDSPGQWATQANEWLKVQEDIQQNADGTYTVSEAWQGADKFWEELYGSPSERWPIGGYH